MVQPPRLCNVRHGVVVHAPVNELQLFYPCQAVRALQPANRAGIDRVAAEHVLAQHTVVGGYVKTRAAV